MTNDEQKADLLKSYTKKHGTEPKDTFGAFSEKNTSYYNHRNAFIQDIALEIAVAVKHSTGESFGDNAENYINSNPTYLNMLTEYFSSDEFQVSQEKAAYRRAYTVCLNNDIFNKAADLLELPFMTFMPNCASTTKYAYQQSRHYQEAKDTKHLENGSEGKVHHADFYGENLFEHPVLKENTLLNAANIKIPTDYSMFTNEGPMETSKTNKHDGTCSIM